MNPTLVVLAAGMGSRYGGLKQLEGFGPRGQTIMDYTLHDAARAGVRRAVLVIAAGFFGTNWIAHRSLRPAYMHRHGDGEDNWYPT